MFYTVRCKNGKEFELKRKIIMKWKDRPCNHCRSFECPNIANKYIGKKRNHLTAIRFDHYDEHGAPIFEFECDCGNHKLINLDHVKSGSTKSCGCKREIGIEKHGLSRTRIYKTHQQMIQRCYNPNVPKYNIYGGRGIRVCDEWLEPAPQGFLNFYEWAMSHGYQDDLTIDRIDVNWNYCPENCRFITVQEQNYNRRDTIRYDSAGETLLDLYRKYANPEIDYETLKSRFDKTLHTYDDWSVNDKLNIPPLKHMKEYRRDHHIIDPIYFVDNKGGK